MAITKHYKITNVSSADAKCAAKKDNTSTVGIILAPGHFFVCCAADTKSIDLQVRRGLLKVDKNYVNTYKLELCKPYSEKELEAAAKSAKDYTKN